MFELLLHTECIIRFKWTLLTIFFFENSFQPGIYFAHSDYPPPPPQNFGVYNPKRCIFKAFIPVFKVIFLRFSFPFFQFQMFMPYVQDVLSNFHIVLALFKNGQDLLDIIRESFYIIFLSWNVLHAKNIWWRAYLK